MFAMGGHIKSIRIELGLGDAYSFLRTQRNHHHWMGSQRPWVRYEYAWWRLAGRGRCMGQLQPTVPRFFLFNILSYVLAWSPLGRVFTLPTSSGGCLGSAPVRRVLIISTVRTDFSTGTGTGRANVHGIPYVHPRNDGDGGTPLFKVSYISECASASAQDPALASGYVAPLPAARNSINGQPNNATPDCSTLQQPYMRTSAYLARSAATKSLIPITVSTHAQCHSGRLGRRAAQGSARENEFSHTRRRVPRRGFSARPPGPGSASACLPQQPESHGAGRGFGVPQTCGTQSRFSSHNAIRCEACEWEWEGIGRNGLPHLCGPEAQIAGRAGYNAARIMNSWNLWSSKSPPWSRRLRPTSDVSVDRRPRECKVDPTPIPADVGAGWVTLRQA
ncbi:hypothetical protein B0H11DRAFT_2193939 [Mycena galericulata]|nr:hypothetical protein B0H11DRAFT_2193939 [Mycena galericulata]